MVITDSWRKEKVILSRLACDERTKPETALYAFLRNRGFFSFFFSHYDLFEENSGKKNGSVLQYM